MEVGLRRYLGGMEGVGGSGMLRRQIGAAESGTLVMKLCTGRSILGSFDFIITSCCQVGSWKLIWTKKEWKLRQRHLVGRRGVSE